MAPLPSLSTVRLSVSGGGHTLLALMDRPKAYNSFSKGLYEDLLKTLEFAKKTDSVKGVVISGNGKLYSSGLDMNPQFLDNILRKDAAIAKEVDLWRTFVDSLIDFPKLLVSAVNGNAFGIGVTTLALFDSVYSVPEATYKTPFAELGLCAEGCSSHTFSRILGPALATRFLLLSETLPAAALVASGFVSSILPASPLFGATVQELVDSQVSRLPLSGIMESKMQTRDEETRQRLREVNLREMERIKVLLQGEEFLKAARKFKEKGEARAKVDRNSS